jgi:hypothetical protein
VAAAGCRSLADLRRVGWRHFEGRDNCGRQTLAELSEFIGEWPDPPGNRDVWIRHASDDFLIEELRRRGHMVERRETP